MSDTKPLKRAIELQPLSHDHHQGLLLCWKIRTGLKKEVPLERIKSYTDWFFDNHLKPHFELEEKYIFTILGNDNPLIQQALSEHSRLTDLFTATTDLKENLSFIEKELDAHIRFEERVLFGEIQLKASVEQLAKIEEIHSKLPFIENDEATFWL
ncbi:hemerythrin domain-containing protein [uncultured Flavobacterium sp.]|uniref:hemerythrin domain-containing protein n=1 Tax=uncultured Flavobacterium sp. TaxID=165435 RepID=UPI0030EEB254|tara:strand:- start:517 stop:981 length:465 start_codon:yes stop_codon:yes gene_type:complete